MFLYWREISIAYFQGTLKQKFENLFFFFLNDCGLCWPDNRNTVMDRGMENC